MAAICTTNSVTKPRHKCQVLSWTCSKQAIRGHFRTCQMHCTDAFSLNAKYKRASLFMLHRRPFCHSWLTGGRRDSCRRGRFYKSVAKGSDEKGCFAATIDPMNPTSAGDPTAINRFLQAAWAIVGLLELGIHSRNAERTPHPSKTLFRKWLMSTPVISCAAGASEVSSMSKFESWSG